MLKYEHHTGANNLKNSKTESKCLKCEEKLSSTETTRLMTMDVHKWGYYLSVVPAVLPLHCNSNHCPLWNNSLK